VVPWDPVVRDWDVTEEDYYCDLLRYSSLDELNTQSEKEKFELTRSIALVCTSTGETSVHIQTLMNKKSKEASEHSPATTHFKCSFNVFDLIHESRIIFATLHFESAAGKKRYRNTALTKDPLNIRRSISTLKAP